MTKVHAPYHFVPLSKWVYMPDWAHLVSHDFPFKEGYSGVIEYTLTNATALCVGDTQVKKEDGTTLIKLARNPYQQPIIPGSSLKGMIRNVLEIASFGKFSAIDNNHFSHRDVSTGNNYLKNVAPNPETKAAWLKYDETKLVWTLTTCQWAKIKHADLNKERIDNVKEEITNEQSAIEKYKNISLNTIVNIEPKKVERKPNEGGDYYLAQQINHGTTPSHLVFTNKRIIGDTGAQEDYNFSYCFYGEENEVQIEAEELGKIVATFIASHNAKQNSQQLKYLLNNANKLKGIPVFAVFDRSRNSLNLKALGLAKMPRIQYKHSVHQLAFNQQGQYRISEHLFDMCELMLGTLRNNGMSIKSRVYFADATHISNNKIQTVESNKVVLASPKASFLACYLEQPKSNHYNTYDNGFAKLSGWKRYISASKFVEIDSSNNSDAQKNETKSILEMLPANNKFGGRIMFNNLTPAELGALLWTLQIGDNEQAKDLYHNLGHGKSLGAGTVQIKINSVELSCNSSSKNKQKNTSQDEISTNIQSFIQLFIEHMNAAYPSDSLTWAQSPQIKYLQTAANRELNKDRTLRYNTLGDGKHSDQQEFKNIKKYKESLPKLKDVKTRIEPSDVIPSGIINFTQGRLSSLVSLKDKEDSWYKAEIKKVKKLEKEQISGQEQAKIAAMPMDLQKATSFKISLEKAESINEKRLLNTAAQTLITEFLSVEYSKEAAQLLYDIINNKELCEYINGTNKKKIIPRKALLSELQEKYQLQTNIKKK